ncbi:MAG TPA: hypothetical protein VFO79_15480, partial [Xanthomonadales bacterium]|nr:hypothetical protein [Xanthomonadales bacterium]
MKFLRSLRKPAWEGRDPVERARAVATETAPELVARLPDLARLDPDAQVRRAAVRRLHDLALLADRMRLDTDAGVRDAARGRLDALLTDRTQLAPLAERIRLMRVEEDADLLVRVAEAAPEAELRRVALERIERPGLIAERCQKDPDLDVRLWLLGRIESPSMLERIAEATRRGDKHLSRAARDRLDALKLAAGDPDTVKRRALAMCETLDALRRTRPADTAAQLDGLRREWSALKPLLGADVVTRVEGYFRVFDPTPARVAEPVPETVAAPAAEAEIAESAPPQAPSEPDAKLAQLVGELDERHATIERAAFEALRR